MTAPNRRKTTTDNYGAVVQSAITHSESLEAASWLGRPAVDDYGNTAELRRELFKLGLGPTDNLPATSAGSSEAA